MVTEGWKYEEMSRAGVVMTVWHPDILNNKKERNKDNKGTTVDRFERKAGRRAKGMKTGGKREGDSAREEIIGRRRRHRRGWEKANEKSDDQQRTFISSLAFGRSNFDARIEKTESRSFAAAESRQIVNLLRSTFIFSETLIKAHLNAEISKRFRAFRSSGEGGEHCVERAAWKQSPRRAEEKEREREKKEEKKGDTTVSCWPSSIFAQIWRLLRELMDYTL